MNKITWKDSSSALRKMLRDLDNPDGETAILKFGKTYNPTIGSWLIYNVLTDNVIAVVRIANNGGNTLVRYRPNSIYAEILSRYRPSANTVRVKSSNLGRYRRFARDRLREITRRSLHDYRESTQREEIPRPINEVYAAYNNLSSNRSPVINREIFTGLM